MLTVKELNQKIAGIKRSIASVRENIHEVLCHAAGHAYEHGDVTAFTRLFNAVAGADRHAITRWVGEFGFAHLQKDGTFKSNKVARKAADFADGDAVVQYLMDNELPWYAYTKSASKVASDLDVEKSIRNLMKRVQKTIAEGERNVVVPFGTRKAAAELFDMIESIRADRANTTFEGSEGYEPKDVTPEPRMIAAE